MLHRLVRSLVLPLSAAAPLALLVACPAPGSAGRPVIGTFEADPATIAAGATSTLTWTVTGADTLRLDPGGVDVTDAGGREVSPAATTTYTLTAVNGDGASERDATVAVVAPGALEVAITGLEETTFVSGALTFAVAVVGGTPDSLELRRDGALFQVLDGGTFIWDTAGTPDGSYGFVARARLGGESFDSAPKVVVVDHTAPAVTVEAVASAAPLVLPGVVTLSVEASDANGVSGVTFLDGEAVLGTASSAPFTLAVPLATGEHGTHHYRARAADRAGNVAVAAATPVIGYRRQTATLTSEADLDGCVEVGYDAPTFRRLFAAPSCTFTTSYAIVHFFSFDRSALPEGTLVEEAVLRFLLDEASAYEASKLASVAYADTGDAPPVVQVYPYVSAEPETDVELLTEATGYPLRDAQRLDVSALVRADVEAGRARSQLRLRSLNNGPSGLGGSLFFAEAGDGRAPTLDLTVLAP